MYIMERRIKKSIIESILLETDFVILNFDQKRPTARTFVTQRELNGLCRDNISFGVENRISLLLNGRFFAVRCPHSLAQYCSFGFRVSVQPYLLRPELYVGAYFCGKRG